jgi:glycosyltransferase 2 family protein
VSTAEAPRATRRRLAGAAGVLVSLLFLGAIVWWASRQEPPELPSTGGAWAALGSAVALYFVACAIRGERWHVLLLENGARPHRADTYGLIAVGYLGNNILPARAGDALRVVLLTPRAQTDARTVIGTLVAERLLDVLVLGALFLLLAYGVLSGAGTDLLGDRAGAALVVLGIVLAVVVAGVAILHVRGQLRRVIDFVRPMIRATANLRGRHGVEALVLTVLVWASEGVVWWLTAEAAGLGVTFIEALYLLALSSMLVLVPAGPGYAGTMDAAILIGSRALDKSASAALTYLLLLRFVLMVPIGLAGLVVGATRYGGVGRVLRARRGTPPEDAAAP